MRLTIATGALLLASAHLALAQQPPPASVPQVPGGLTGVVDVGVRAGSTTGDEARFERFRDLRSGAFSRITFGKDTDQVMFAGLAENIGYRDQHYALNYHGGRARVSGSWDSVPLNYSYVSSTPWTESSPGVFALDAAARTAVQTRAAGVVGIPATAAQLATPSIFRGLARPFDLQSRRDVAAGGVGYDLGDKVGVDFTFASTKRGGNQPFGMSFAFNNANELAMPLDNRTNDLSAGLEWANPKSMVRIGWDGSWFNNNIHEIVWDNPLRATDTTPFDPSGYSNGNGPAVGRMSVPPSNSMNTIRGTGLYKLPARSTINGTVSFTAMNQNDTLIPWTSNPAVANPSVYAAFPNLANLPRATAEASVHGVNALVNFTSRPTRLFGLSLRYRFNDHKNLTPVFDATEYVRFDAVPEETGGETEHFNIRQNTFDATGTFSVLPYTALRIGYGLDDVDRTGRSFSGMRDHTFRTSLDTVGNQYVSVRVSFEHTARTGSGFSESALEDGGAQPGLRFYDEADRDRSRGTVLFVTTPLDIVDITFSVTAGHDTYKGEGHDFGLLNNTNKAYNAGVNINPMKQVAFGINVGYDTYHSLQNSRNANPPGSDYGSWTDPNRTWNLDNDEKVKNVDLYLDLLKAVKNTDIRIGYAFSDSDSAFVFSGPRIQELSTNTFLTPGDAAPCGAGLTSCFEQLPKVANSWHQFSADATYFFTAKVGVGLAYWFEKLDIVDFNTIDLPGQPGTPRIDYLGEINTGYGNRPYKGNTGFVRLMYLF